MLPTTVVVVLLLSSHLIQLLGEAPTTPPRVGRRQRPPPLLEGYQGVGISDTTMHVVAHPFTSGPLLLAIVASSCKVYIHTQIN